MLLNLLTAVTWNKTAQCNLGTDCITTPGGRPIQSPHTIVQLYLPGYANAHAHLIHDSLHPAHSPPKRRLNCFSHFCRPGQFRILPIC